MRALRFATRLLVLPLVLGLASPASAQILDDTWLKLKVIGKGYLVDNETGEATKRTFKAVGFLHLVAQVEDAPAALGGPPSQSYDYDLWMLFDDEWSITDSGTFNMFGTDELLFIADEDPNYATGKIANFGGYQAAEFKNKLGKKGELKSCTYKTLGAELITGTETGAEQAVGGYKAQGKSIDVSKLPFDPTPKPVAPLAPQTQLGQGQAAQR